MCSLPHSQMFEIPLSSFTSSAAIYGTGGVKVDIYGDSFLQLLLSRYKGSFISEA